jgi:poly-gamma-glutamate synthesis protein (capsule biosynthesis protein)
MQRIFIGAVILFVFGGLMGFFVYQQYSKVRLGTSQELNVSNKVGDENLELKNIVKKDNKLRVSSFITPHHLVADKLIENIFSEVSEQNKGQKIDRIVLVSPNHFNVGQGGIIIADGPLQEKERIFQTDNAVLQKILNLNFVHGDEDAFYKEHGIRGLLPFVEKYFPDTALLNIMIKDGTAINDMERLAQAVAEADGNTLVILSSDFSHYLSRTVSDWHDKKAVDVISNFDYPAVYNLETDCVTGLYFLMKFSELQDSRKFIWSDNSNSSKVYRDDFVGENTSYVTGYFKKENVKYNKESSEINKTNKSVDDRMTSILFLGDLMLDRHNKKLMNRHGVGYFTEKIERLFWGQDLNVINLEGPITNGQSVAVDKPVDEPNHFRFTFDPEQTINFLQANRINLVNIGNNHILNFHNDGLEQTEKFLEEGEVSYFGDPIYLEKMFVIKNVNNRRVAFVNYNQFGKFSVEDTVQIIKQIKNEVEFVVVYTHWGREYELVENDNQRNKAHQFIDAGADLIIGSHPHVVQPMEIYQGKVIFYSLGNFVFDQYFSEEVRSILGVGILLEEGNISFSLIPLYMQDNGQLEMMAKERKQKFLQNLIERSKIDGGLKTNILESEQFELTQ